MAPKNEVCPTCFRGYFSRVTLQEQITALAKDARQASRALAKLSTAEKNTRLVAMADGLIAGKDAVLKANTRDMEVAQNSLSAAMLDRLRLDEKRIVAMANGLREV